MPKYATSKLFTPEERAAFHFRRFSEQGLAPNKAVRRVCQTCGKTRDEVDVLLIAAGIDVDGLIRKADAEKTAGAFRKNVSKGLAPGVALNKAAGRRGNAEAKALLSEAGVSVERRKPGPAAAPVVKVAPLAWKDGPGCVMFGPQELLDAIRSGRPIKRNSVLGAVGEDVEVQAS